jgi:transposase InsO family protein
VKRWKLVIQDYDFDIKHTPGVLNVVADALSRLCYIENHILLIESDYKPSRQQSSLIHSVHNSVIGHHGVERTLEKLRKLNKNWKYMREHVRRYILQCPCCQAMSWLRVPIQAEKFITTTLTPMTRLAVDTIGPLPESSDGTKHIIVIIDCFTRFVELYPAKDVTALSAAKALIQHSGRYGFASELKSDNGSQFVNETIQQLLMLLGTEHSLTLRYSKPENSVVERVNGEVLRHLKAILFNKNIKDNWQEYLPFVQRIINANVNKSIGASPAQLLFGNSIDLDQRLVSDIVFNLPENKEITISDWASKMLSKQQMIIKVAQETQLKHYNEHLADQPLPTKFDVNSYVMVAYPESRMGMRAPNKLEGPWRGPWQVVKSVSNKYTLYDPVTGKFENVLVRYLKKFEYDPEEVNPGDIALRRENYVIVDSVITHIGNTSNRSELKFKIKWQDESEDSWEPWSNLKNNSIIHQYLADNRMSSLIPSRYRGDYIARLTPVVSNNIIISNPKRKRKRKHQ